MPLQHTSDDFDDCKVSGTSLLCFCLTLIINNINIMMITTAASTTTTTTTTTITPTFQS